MNIQELNNHGNLYRFRLKQTCIFKGQGVEINGPYDKYGYVLAEEDTNKDGTLYLIRGTKEYKNPLRTYNIKIK